MLQNLVLDELHDVRTRILAEHGAALGDYMRGEFERLKLEGHPISRIKQRKISCAETTRSNKGPANDRILAPGERSR